MARIVAISNQKGGVGKTTMSVNLGKNLSRRGYRILMIDNDPQGNLSLARVGDQRPDLLAAGTGPGPAHADHLFIKGASATPRTGGRLHTHFHTRPLAAAPASCSVGRSRPARRQRSWRFAQDLECAFHSSSTPP